MTRDKQYKILQPQYYSKFRCEPSKCHETCCERWKIIIDKNTYNKYMHSENSIIKGIAEDRLSLNQGSGSDEDFAFINLTNEMECPFLNKNNLCEIFINRGENSLSKTCKSYPRAIILVDDVMERGLEMSCSVAAELILQDEKGIKFEHVVESISSDDIYINSPKTEYLEQIEIVKKLRTILIDLLQTRTIALSERVVIIGYVLNQVIESIGFIKDKHQVIISEIKEANDYINKYKSLKNPDALQSTHQFRHLNTILSMKFKEGDSISFFSKRYIECLMQVLDAFGGVKEKDLENNYKRNYEKYLKPYLDKKSYILENFLVNYIFIYSSDFFNLKDIWNSYMKLCVIYGLLKFNLVGLATNNKGMNDDLALKLIQSLSKTVISDRTYLKSVIKYLEDEKLDTYHKLITLIMD